MAIPLFGEIERLITEHGSAVILKERVAQLREQMELLEKKTTTLERENEELKTKTVTLECQIANLKQEIQRRDDVIQKHESHNGHLEEVKEKILTLLAANDSYTHAIAQALNISSQVATFHLEELEEKQLIYRSLSMTGQEYPWELAQEGRRYLITHGLLA